MQNKVKEVKKRYEKKWLSIKGVVAIGIGNISANKIGLIISVVDDEKKYQSKFPEEIDGVSIKIQKTGELKAL